MLGVARRFAYSLVPLGFGMWLAHYSFHFFTSAGAIIPAAQRFAVDNVRNQVASLRSAVAQLKLDEAQLVLAQRDFDRAAELITSRAISPEQYDERRATLNVARDKVAAQSEIVQEARAELSLPRDTENPSEIPANIQDRNPGVQAALSTWATSLVKVGAPVDVLGKTDEALRTEMDRWLAVHISAKATDALVDSAPAILVMQARLRRAEADLAMAQLNLTYTEIKAPFDGFVTKRTVNPGDYVTPGQNLLALQSLRDVWVDANFKETQLHNLLIGMPVRIYADAYPGVVFAGRVAGFSPATGSRLSLLPPENATGNFVKVVQRLPVRIEFDQPPPTETPLFVGLSVEPHVHFKATPHGPHAGQRLRLPQPGSAVTTHSAPKPPPSQLARP